VLDLLGVFPLPLSFGRGRATHNHYLSLEHMVNATYEYYLEILNELNRLGLGLGWVSTFMDCMFDTNNKKR